MEAFGHFAVRHPVLIGALFGVLCGIGGYNAFRAGVNYSRLCAAASVLDQAASEALGG